MGSCSGGGKSFAGRVREVGDGALAAYSSDSDASVREGVLVLIRNHIARGVARYERFLGLHEKLLAKNIQSGVFGG